MIPTNLKGYLRALAFCIPSLLSNLPAVAQTRSFVGEGVVDARTFDFSSSKMALNGDWDFYPQKFLTQDDLANHHPVALMVPSLWNAESGVTNVGFGTYALMIILPPGERNWALEIPQLYNSYDLYADGVLIGKNGQPSSAKETSQPEWRPQVVPLKANGDTTRIILHVSNFHHFKGGIREPIFFGPQKSLESKFNTAIAVVLIEVGVLVIIAGFFLFIYLRGSRPRIAIYFSILCLSWALRELFSDLYPVSTLFPGINWFFMVRMEYAMLFSMTISGVLFINQLFRDLTSEIFKYLIVFISVVYLFFIILVPVIVFTRWLPLYMLTALAVLVYAAVSVVRAMILEKTGAWFLIGGLILSIVALGYDMIAYRAALPNHIIIGSICYTLIFLSFSIGLLQHLGVIRSNGGGNTLRYQDLYR